ncbi:hypothetical protein ACJIZ3_002802 [Penstemon smallii]|uniref:Uncharacterized protein n=1 Tax=Penstemon smallii TaxID=265156 RepID=A0ABD3U7E6_9LAMI
MHNSELHIQIHEKMPIISLGQNSLGISSKILLCRELANIIYMCSVLRDKRMQDGQIRNSNQRF